MIIYILIYIVELINLFSLTLVMESFFSDKYINDDNFLLFIIFYFSLLKISDFIKDKIKKERNKNYIVFTSFSVISYLLLIFYFLSNEYLINNMYMYCFIFFLSILFLLADILFYKGINPSDYFKDKNKS